MKGNVWVKLIFCLFLIGALLFSGLLIMFVTAFAGLVRFYTPLSAVITVFLIIYSVLYIFSFVKAQTLNRILVSFFAICLCVTAGYELDKAYHRSFATLPSSEVDMHKYRPFIENTKAVSLEESASLKLEKDLPRLDGATALYPIYSAFAQAVYPEKEYNIYRSEVMVNKTDEAYRNIINGEADIIFVLGPSKLQLEHAKNRNVELVLTPIGREAFVFFVHSKNPVSGLTTEQIQDIYSGKITNWSEVGGKNDKIRAFQRPQDSGSQTALQRLMEGKELMTPPKEDVIGGMGGIIQQTASYRNYKNAIGYSFRFFATEMIQNGEIRLLEVDGVYPSKETIRSDEYPLSAEFYAVTRADETNPNVDALIEWILSPQGQLLIEETGYVSLGEGK